MSDEKKMVATNALNALRQLDLGAKLQKQVAKRDDASVPSEEVLSDHFAVVAAPVAKATIIAVKEASGSEAFFDLWDEYYPRVVSLLGWATWVIPGKQLTIIKSMLAVVNSLMPQLRQIMT